VPYAVVFPQLCMLICSAVTRFRYVICLLALDIVTGCACTLRGICLGRGAHASSVGISLGV
jgi:general stress protein CsbA